VRKLQASYNFIEAYLWIVFAVQRTFIGVISVVFNAHNRVILKW